MSDYYQVSNQALFATFFSSNIGFWMENSYFDKTAFKPLLHLWSLGIEIQFYLLLPILYWIVKKFRIGLPLLMLASFFICFVLVGISPKTAFFLLPFRLWEFLLGFFVAKYIYKRWTDKNEILTWLGTFSIALIIGLSFVNVDGKELGFMLGHPGLGAFLVSIATATTLSFGIHKIISKNVISDFLENVGGYSYSIYLAHFPVIVFVLYQPFSGTVLKAASLYQSALLIILVIGASTLLYKFVEQPFRKNKNALRWVVASFVVVIGICPFGAMMQKVFISEKEALIYQAWFDRAEYRCGKLNRIITPLEISCELTEPNNNPLHRVLLVGNSHADSIKSTFSTVAQAANLSVYFMVENNPLMKGAATNPERLIEEARNKHIDAIVLHYSPKGIDYTTIEKLASLAKEFKISLSFIMPVPVWSTHIPAMLIKNIQGKENIPSQTIYDYRELYEDLVTSLAKINYDKFKVYQVADILCDSKCRVVSDDGKPLYFDGGHMTLTGSKMLTTVFYEVINDLI